jgi:predicted DNA-binding protein
MSVTILGVKTLTMKLPDELLVWLEREAKRANRGKSTIVREILLQHQRTRHRSALDLAADLCGSVQSGVRDLAHNKKHLKGFGR